MNLCAERAAALRMLADYESRKTVLLKDIIPNWWGEKRYKD